MRLIGLIMGLMVVSALFTGCNKKDDPALTNAGGGASNQSVVTLMGAAS